MYVTIVKVYVKEPHIQDFIDATQNNHEQSVQEQGNRRFDILQSQDDPSHLVLYEAYASKEDAAAHKDTAHYLTWRQTVADWMAKPREGIVFNGLFPSS